MLIFTFLYSYYYSLIPTSVFTAALFTIAGRGSNLNAHQWTNGQKIIGIECTQRKDKMMPSAATWTDLKGVAILSKVSQTEKDKIHDITFIWKI